MFLAAAVFMHFQLTREKKNISTEEQANMTRVLASWLLCSSTKSASRAVETRHFKCSS
jgi:hypothetical protein